MLAKEYGQLPETIENQEPYWLNRMLALQEAESENAKEEMRKANANKARR
jgi:hypothetical protein